MGQSVAPMLYAPLFVDRLSSGENLSGISSVCWSALSNDEAPPQATSHQDRLFLISDVSLSFALLYDFPFVFLLKNAPSKVGHFFSFINRRVG